MNIDIIANRLANDLEKLSAFTATPGNGCTRLPFTKEALQAQNYLKNIMEQAGLSVETDGVGNIFAVRKGKNQDLPCIMMGSHYDSVISGGNYDGIAGVVCAVEIARILNENNVNLEQDFVVAAFHDEEGLRFSTGYFGSNAMLGNISAKDCETFKDRDGISIAQAMKEWDLDHTKIKDSAKNIEKIGEFIEIHIEQGPVLDSEKIQLGLVECIVGMERFIVNVNGRADHAGTTPMDMRIDAVDIATKVVSKLADLAREKTDGTVATTGFFRVFPGGMNIVAQRAEFSLDIRSKNSTSITDIVDTIKNELEFQCNKYGASYEMDKKLEIMPCNLDENMLDGLEKSCVDKGYSYKRMLSGAGHDSLTIGHVLPTVMVFVPSKDGRSHCPDEHSEYIDLAKSVDIVYDLITK